MNLNDLYEMKDPRDVANSTSGFGKNSQAYRADGGANDERHDLDQQPTWYIRLNGKLIRDKAGNPYSFQSKAAANKAALTMQAKLFNKDKEFVLTTNPNDKSQGVAEGLNEMDKTQTPPGRDGDIDWTKKQIHLGPEHTMKAKDVAKHALKILNKTMKKSHADTPKKKGVAEDQLDEKWSQKYKDSINCSNPKGFSQKAHCAGEKKNEDMAEGKEYYTVTGTDSVSLRRDFNMAKDRNGWYLKEGATPKQKLEAFRAFGSPKLKEFNLAAFSGGTQTKGEDNVISPVGSQTRAQYKK